jgi:hypothetical protein
MSASSFLLPFIVAMLVVSAGAAGTFATHPTIPQPAPQGFPERVQSSQPPLQTDPVNVTRNYASSPAPTGVADYGVENVGGSVSAYKMALSSVTGTAMLNSVNSSSEFGLWTLQLNVVMKVNTTAGSYSYWLQDVFIGPWKVHQLVHADFDYSIWNWTAPYASMNSTWVSGGNGALSPWCTGSDCSGAGAGCTLTGCYTYEGGVQCCNYSLPLGLRLGINVSYSGSGVRIGFSGASAIGIVPLSTHTSTYDTVTISEPNTITDAAILVDGYEMAPGIQLGRQTYYEADFVFAGPGNLETSTFTSMNATISMSYTLENGSVIAPLSVFEFGETGERAANLAVTPTDLLHGFEFHVGLGRTNSEVDYVRKLQTLESLSASYSFLGEPPSGMTAVLDYVNNGTETFMTLGTSPTTFRADAGTDWRVITEGAPSNSTLRWAPSQANGTVSGMQVIHPVYYQQLLVHLGFEVTGGGEGYTNPLVNFTQFGRTTTSTANSSVWMDAGASYSYPYSLAGSGPTERWISNNTAGTVSGPGKIQVNYQHQYSVTIAATEDGSVSYVVGSYSGTISPGTAQTFYVQPGTEISLTATPASFWYEFGGWGGAGGVSGSQIHEPISSAVSFKGDFSINALNIIGALTLVGGLLVLGVFVLLRKVRGPIRQHSGLGAQMTPENLKGFEPTVY